MQKVLQDKIVGVCLKKLLRLKRLEKGIVMKTQVYTLEETHMEPENHTRLVEGLFLRAIHQVGGRVGGLDQVAQTKINARSAKPAQCIPGKPLVLRNQGFGTGLWFLVFGTNWFPVIVVCLNALDRITRSVGYSQTASNPQEL